MHETLSSQSINKMHEKIKLKTHTVTTFTIIQINFVNTVKSFHVWKSIQITLPHKEPFGLQKYQLYLYANVFKRHIPSRLLRPRTSESEFKANTCNCWKANVWKKAHPYLLRLCFSELKCRSPYLHKFANYS